GVASRAGASAMQVRFRTDNLRHAWEPNVWPLVFGLGALSRLLAAAGNRGKTPLPTPFGGGSLRHFVAGDPHGGCVQRETGEVRTPRCLPLLANMAARR